MSPLQSDKPVRAHTRSKYFSAKNRCKLNFKEWNEQRQLLTCRHSSAIAVLFFTAVFVALQDFILSPLLPFFSHIAQKCLLPAQTSGDAVQFSKTFVLLNNSIIWKSVFLKKKQLLYTFIVEIKCNEKRIFFNGKEL